MEVMVMELGDRMKAYEKVNNHVLTIKTPVLLRIDGRCFHSFTRGFVKPFDKRLILAMQLTAEDLMKLSGNCVLAYVQSDEISVVLKDWQAHETQPFFDNKVQKLSSIFSSMATSSFIRNWFAITGDLVDVQFDARCWNLPKDEVANYFHWRQQDWTRNSIQMLARSKFSQKELQGKNQSEMHEMLWSKHDINWDKLDTHLKRGTFLYKKDGKVFIDKECPIITQDRDYVERHLEADK